MNGAKRMNRANRMNFPDRLNALTPAGSGEGGSWRSDGKIELFMCGRRIMSRKDLEPAKEARLGPRAKHRSCSYGRSVGGTCYANVIHISSMKFASETNLSRTRIRKILALVLVLCMAAELSSLAAGVTSQTEADSASFSLLLLLLLSGIAQKERERGEGEADWMRIQRYIWRGS